MTATKNAGRFRAQYAGIVNFVVVVEFLRKFKLSNQLLALQSEEHVCGDRECGEECA